MHGCCLLPDGDYNTLSLTQVTVHKSLQVTDRCPIGTWLSDPGGVPHPCSPGGRQHRGTSVESQTRGSAILGHQRAAWCHLFTMCHCLRPFSLTVVLRRWGWAEGHCLRLGVPMGERSIGKVLAPHSHSCCLSHWKNYCAINSVRAKGPHAGEDLPCMRAVGDC